MRQIIPPLSIALFGNWGSGKSFFMRQIQRRVRDICSSVSENEESYFYRNVVQIEFNAWHYVEADLWASLVSHIFENLKEAGVEKESDWQIRRDNLLRKLGIAKQSKGEAEVVLADAKTREQDAKQHLITTQLEAQRTELAVQKIEAADFIKTEGISAELKPVMNCLREMSVQCKYIPALSLGWRSKENRIRVMSAMKSGRFALRT